MGMPVNITLSKNGSARFGMILTGGSLYSFTLPDETWAAAGVLTILDSDNEPVAACAFTTRVGDLSLNTDYFHAQAERMRNGTLQSVTFAIYSSVIGATVATGNVLVKICPIMANAENFDPVLFQGGKGDTGDTGATGATGATGLTGPQGERGEQGLPGEQGIQGTPGFGGPMGLPGEKGDKGDQGERGVKGEEGSVGPVGPVGPEGPSGPVGAEGSEGPQGVQGVQGPEGPQGIQGPAGAPLSETILALIAALEAFDPNSASAGTAWEQIKKLTDIVKEIGNE